MVFGIFDKLKRLRQNNNNKNKDNSTDIEQREKTILLERYNTNIFENENKDNKNKKERLTIKEPQTLVSEEIENNRLRKYKLNNQWVNPTQGINSGLGTANLSFYNYQVVNYMECSFLSQDPLISNIIDILTNTPFTNGGEIILINDNGEYIENTEIIDILKNKLLKKYNFYETLKAAVKSSFIFGGCLLYLDYGDKNYLESQLDFEKIDKTKFKGFKLIDPIQCGAIDVNTTDPTAKDYMNPTRWYINGLGTVHKSRLIKFSWNEPPNFLKSMCMYFGYPLTQLLKQDVANYNLVTQGLANLVNKIRRTYIKMDKMSFVSGNVETVKNRLQLMQLIENNFTIFPIDLNEDVVQLTTSLSGIRDTIETFLNVLSCKTGIQRNKLSGENISGLNSNAANKEANKNFIEKITTIQNGLIYKRLIEMLQIIAGTIDNKIYNFDYKFSPLYVMSENEISDAIDKNVDIALKMNQLGISTEDCITWLKSKSINNMNLIDGIDNENN